MSNPNQDSESLLRQISPDDLRIERTAATTPAADRTSTIQAGESDSSRRPRQASCPSCGGAGYFLYAVPYTHADFGKLQKCACENYQRQIASATARLGDELGALAHKTFDSFDLDRPLQPANWQGAPMSVKAQEQFMRSAHKRCQRWSEAPAGWLFIHGAFGAGKSHLAAAIANARQAAGSIVRFVTVNKLLDTLRAGIDNGSSDKMINDLISCDLLILDELSRAQLAESASDWRFGRIERLINERLALPTIITSNLAPDDLAAPGDVRAERLADRIAGAAQIIWMPLASYRRIAQAAI